MNNTTSGNIDFTKLADKERQFTLDELLARRSYLIQQSPREQAAVGALITVTHQHLTKHPCPDCPLRD